MSQADLLAITHEGLAYLDDQYAKNKTITNTIINKIINNMMYMGNADINIFYQIIEKIVANQTISEKTLIALLRVYFGKNKDFTLILTPLHNQGMKFGLPVLGLHFFDAQFFVKYFDIHTDICRIKELFKIFSYKHDCELFVKHVCAELNKNNIELSKDDCIAIVDI